jgi:RNA 2',3'-cyclic 3'-phosphodiesterase
VAAVATATVERVAKQRLKSPRARLFVALDLPDELRDGIVAWQRRELRDPALRPLRAQALHVTLAFLGYHPEKQIERIAEAALIEGAEAPTMRLSPEPVGVPRGRRPRLLALDAPSDEAVALQGEVSDRLEGARFYRPEKRPFWPHVTVARMRAERRGSKRPAMVEDPPGPLPDELLRPFPAVALRLYRSYLRREGAEYVPLAELSLKGRG